jgi:hypothetical protein
MILELKINTLKINSIKNKIKDKIGRHKEKFYKIKLINGNLKLKIYKPEELIKFDKLKINLINSAKNKEISSIDNCYKSNNSINHKSDN